MYDSCRECDVPLLVAVPAGIQQTEHRLVLGRDTLVLAPLGPRDPLFHFRRLTDVSHAWSVEVNPKPATDSVYSVTLDDGAGKGLDPEDRIIIIPRNVGTAPILIQANTANPYCGTPQIRLTITVTECPVVFNGDPVCSRTPHSGA